MTMRSSAGDPELGILPLIEWDGKPPGATTWDGSITEAGTKMRSYYGRPVIKEPVWEPEIPVYFFTGGLGGASAVLGQIARLAGARRSPGGRCSSRRARRRSARCC